MKKLLFTLFFLGAFVFLYAKAPVVRIKSTVVPDTNQVFQKKVDKTLIPGEANAQSGISLRSGTNQVSTWTGNSNSVWSNEAMMGGNWTGNRSYFTEGDIVNFTGTGIPTVEVGDIGTGAVAMYLSGNKDYIFSGDPIVTRTGNSGFTGGAATGKLVLGKVASGTSPNSSAAKTPFTGVLTLDNQSNTFSEGIEINSGTLKVSTLEQLGTDLSKVEFDGEGTLHFTKDVVFDGGNADRHRMYSMHSDVKISLESGVSYTVSNNWLPFGEGGVFHFIGKKLQNTLSFVTADTGITTEPRFFFTGNKAEMHDGGAFSIWSGLVNITNASFSNNEVANNGDSRGGAIFNSGVATITEAMFTENIAPGYDQGGSGGAIFTQKELNLTNALFNRNEANLEGGAIFNLESVVNLVDTDFTNNKAAFGGAFSTQGGNNTFTVTDGAVSLFSGNLSKEGGPSIFFLSYIWADTPNSILTVDTQGKGLLDMRDAMEGQSGYIDYPGDCSIDITKKGSGTWKLGGKNRFISVGTDDDGYGKTVFKVNEGKLYLYGKDEVENANPDNAGAKVQAGSITIEGTSSSFTFGDGTGSDTLSVYGGNSIEVTEGVITFNENTVLQFSPANLTTDPGLSLSAVTIDLLQANNKPVFNIDLTDWQPGSYTLISANQDIFSQADLSTVTVTINGSPLPSGIVIKLSTANDGKDLVVGFGRSITAPEISADVIGRPTYNGNQQTPQFLIMDGTKELKENVDYTLSYATNKDAGFNVGEATIKGIGVYSEERTALFTIDSAPITITADNQTKIYGEADPMLTYTISSGQLYGSDQMMGTLTRIEGEDVGTYAVTMGSLSAGSNYSVSYISGDFIISPAEHSIAFTLPEELEIESNDGKYLLEANSTSGLPVMYKSDNDWVASIHNDGQTLLLNRPGTVVITAYIEEHPNYHLADEVAVTVEVFRQGTGISSVSEEPVVKVYPNPVNKGEYINVETNLSHSSMISAKIEIRNTVGVLIHEQLVNGDVTKVKMPSQSGIYLLKLKTEEFEKTMKVRVK